MGVLHDVTTVSMVFKLMDRGLTGEQIERAMKDMIGDDWREIKVSAWLARLKEQEYVLQNESELTVSDLEALINGRIKLDALNRRKRD